MKFISKSKSKSYDENCQEMWVQYFFENIEKSGIHTQLQEIHGNQVIIRYADFSVTLKNSRQHSATRLIHGSCGDRAFLCMPIT